ncbi:AraC family transcriptional regulator [Agromyces intestinalis]|uniref:AraC family transcriptional regulator n=1 Tax=Agromyces intestinalis TaxID=2592652 RepID=A0A5C1YHD3_9MICO|nr:helix-turn-helix domain-containing protein [Agromyces intestinalis]QEO15626.1 AraC family transcriptional regulator [Agromyces intestinalis]
MTFQSREAPPEWQEFVTRLWYQEVPRPRPYEKILPLPYVHAIVNLSAPYRLFDRQGEAVRVDDAFVSGIQSEYLVIESPPVIRHVGVEFTPQGLRAFTSVPPSEVTGRVLAAEAVLPGAAELAAELRDRAALEPAEALDALESFLRSRRRAGIEADPIATALLAALAADPQRRIGELAVQAGVSHRTLLAHVRAACGMLPKRYAELLRFHRFVSALPIGETMPTWADAAAASGYYDQPHVIRAFRRFSGLAPGEYLALVREFGPDAASFVPLDEVPIAARSSRSESRSESESKSESKSKSKPSSGSTSYKPPAAARR